MQPKLTDSEKQEIIAQYHAGISVIDLCAQHRVPRSTLYFWINRFSPLKTITEKTICYQEYLYLKRHADKLEKRLEVIKAAGCGMAAPLQEKLVALEKLYGQYSVHALGRTKSWHGCGNREKRNPLWKRYANQRNTHHRWLHHRRNTSTTGRSIELRPIFIWKGFCI